MVDDEGTVSPTDTVLARSASRATEANDTNALIFEHYAPNGNGRHTEVDDAEMS